MNSWRIYENELFFHDSKGLILGVVSRFNGQYKAVVGKMFIGWFVTEEYAKKAIEEAYDDIKNKKYDLK